MNIVPIIITIMSITTNVASTATTTLQSLQVLSDDGAAVDGDPTVDGEDSTVDTGWAMNTVLNKIKC